jgi:hypothetical protein
MRDGMDEMDPWSFEMQGRLDEHVLTSEALRGNALGDRHERPLWVYVPPGYDDEPSRRYASVYVIQGLTGQLDMAQSDSVQAELPRARRRDVRRGRCTSGGRGLGRLLDLARRQPVPRLPGTGNYLTISATRSSRSSTLTTGRSPTATIGGSRASRAAATARW